MGLRISLIFIALTIAACGKSGDEGSDGSAQAAVIEPAAITGPPTAGASAPQPESAQHEPMQVPVSPVVATPAPASEREPEPEPEPERAAPAAPAVRAPEVRAPDPLLMDDPQEFAVAEDTPKPIAHPPLPKPRPQIKPEPQAAFPQTESLSSLEQELLHLINAARAAHGRPAVKFSRLQASGSRGCIGSEGHSRHMAETHRMSHDQFPADICMKASMASAENVGYASGEAISALRAVHRLMMNEGPGGGHYENILSRSYNAVGLGFFYTKGRVLWVTENFLSL